MRTKALILGLSFVALVGAAVATPTLAHASDLKVRVHIDGFTFGYHQGHFHPRHSHYYGHHKPHYYERGYGYRKRYHYGQPYYRHYKHYKPGRHYGKRYHYYGKHANRHHRGPRHITRGHHRGQRGFRDVVTGRQHRGKRH
ncbi:MAG: hypothetical protein ACE5NW_03710 [Acidiferrobacterales bacterium]